MVKLVWNLCLKQHNHCQNYTFHNERKDLNDDKLIYITNYD